MKYITNKLFSSLFQPLTLNRSNKPKSTFFLSDNYNLLPLFSRLKQPEYIIRKLLDIYGNDMQLFGYDYHIENGNVYAICENYEEMKMCC